MANTQSTHTKKLATKATKLENKFKDQFETIEDSTLLESMSDSLSAHYEDFKDTVEDAAETSVSFVKKYPLYTLAGALAIGVATAMFLSRREE